MAERDARTHTTRANRQRATHQLDVCRQAAPAREVPDPLQQERRDLAGRERQGGPDGALLARAAGGQQLLGAADLRQTRLCGTQAAVHTPAPQDNAACGFLLTCMLPI